MQTINVLKPFRFSHYANGMERLPVEVSFGLGEHEIDERIATHPWIAGFADGCIEEPAAALVRTEAVRVKSERLQAEATAAKAQAESAIARIVRAAPEDAKAHKLSEEDLNTPLDELRARQSRQDGVTAKRAGKAR